MKVLRPTYVKDFRCDGRLCDARCCHDWNVVVDEDTRQKYSELPDGDEFLRHVTELDGKCVLQMKPSGTCPFLNENFLCGLQLKRGEDFLAAVCQSFPRVTYKLTDEIFLQAMTLTCPLAATEILLSPIAFETVDSLTARMIFDFTTKLSMPAEKFLSEQRAAIDILQRRELSINQRLRKLCEHFGEKSAPVEFDAESHAAAVVEIFGETYDANLTVEKKSRLVETYLTAREKILPNLQTFAPMPENYLVNEFFMRLYPCAFVGDVRLNVRVFVTAWRVAEFAAVLTAVAKSRLTVENFFELLCMLSDKLDHSRGGMSAIRTFAELHDAEIFYALMME